MTTVRSVIRSQIGVGPITRERVARALDFQPRTFAHRLEALGVSFSKLADEVKYEAARSLLLRDKRMSEIATVLGFAVQSAFTRAFKAWSGASPGRWRAERAESP